MVESRERKERPPQAVGELNASEEHVSSFWARKSTANVSLQRVSRLDPQINCHDSQYLVGVLTQTILRLYKELCTENTFRSTRIAFRADVLYDGHEHFEGVSTERGIIEDTCSLSHASSRCLPGFREVLPSPFREDVDRVRSGDGAAPVTPPESVVAAIIYSAVGSSLSLSLCFVLDVVASTGRSSGQARTSQSQGQCKSIDGFYRHWARVDHACAGHGTTAVNSIGTE